jgi:hypothetical protein
MIYGSGCELQYVMNVEGMLRIVKGSLKVYYQRRGVATSGLFIKIFQSFTMSKETTKELGNTRLRLH